MHISAKCCHSRLARVFFPAGIPSTALTRCSRVADSSAPPSTPCFPESAPPHPQSTVRLPPLAHPVPILAPTCSAENTGPRACTFHLPVGSDAPCHAAPRARIVSPPLSTGDGTFPRSFRRSSPTTAWRCLENRRVWGSYENFQRTQQGLGLWSTKRIRKGYLFLFPP